MGSDIARSRELEPFLRIPWTASLLTRPGMVITVPNPRKFKASTEDSLYSETLKTSATFATCISFYGRPTANQEQIEEVSTLVYVGSGINGHPHIMHGGIVAVLLDEGMGILQGINRQRDHLVSVRKGHAEGELPPLVETSYTAELNIKYKSPVHTPGALLVTARYIKRDGRKEHIYAELRQRDNASEDYDGDEVLCATGQALFIAPKPKSNTSKL